MPLQVFLVLIRAMLLSHLTEMTYGPEIDLKWEKKCENLEARYRNHASSS